MIDLIKRINDEIKFLIVIFADWCGWLHKLDPAVIQNYKSYHVETMFVTKPNHDSINEYVRWLKYSDLSFKTYLSYVAGLLKYTSVIFADWCGWINSVDPEVIKRFKRAHIKEFNRYTEYEFVQQKYVAPFNKLMERLNNNVADDYVPDSEIEDAIAVSQYLSNKFREVERFDLELWFRRHNAILVFLKDHDEGYRITEQILSDYGSRVEKLGPFPKEVQVQYYIIKMNWVSFSIQLEKIDSQDAIVQLDELIEKFSAFGLESERRIALKIKQSAIDENYKINS